MTTPVRKPTPRTAVKQQVRAVIPAQVLIPNAAFVRRDKFKRLSFELTEQQYKDLTAQAEALLPTAMTIPVTYDDFKNKLVIRGKVVSGSGVAVDDDETQMPVIDDDHTMEEGATYKVRGALKGTRLGDPPQPCVYFAINGIEPVTTVPAPPAVVEAKPKAKATTKRLATMKPPPGKTGKKPPPAFSTVESDDDDPSENEDDEQQSQA
jgi:hypothetical protein